MSSHQARAAVAVRAKPFDGETKRHRPRASHRDAVRHSAAVCGNVFSRVFNKALT
jgi:hypothetical protein